MRELRYVRNPKRMRIIWIVVYAIIAVVVVTGLLIAGSKIRTHSLPQGEVQLSVPYSKYLVGEVVTYSLKNDYNSPVNLLNKCPNEPLAVYRYEDSEWVRVHDTVNSKNCNEEDQQTVVPAKGIVNGTFANWKQLFNKPGYYRVVAYVEYYNSLPYQDFEVVTAKAADSKNEIPKPAPSPSPTPTPSPSPTPTEAVTPDYTKKTTATVSSSGGKITVQYDNSNVYVTSIAPDSGCSYEGGESGKEVEVTYKCRSGEYQVQLWVEGGVLKAKYEGD